MNKRFSLAECWVLSAWFAAVTLWMARGTLGLPYLSDDFEHGQLIAAIRAGLLPRRDLVMQPFHGQATVLLRLLFWFGTMGGGMSLAWVRVGIVAVHVAGAVGCAILCSRWTGSRLAAWSAGTLYAGALGFVGEQIWWPSSGIFCLGVTFVIFALVALERDRIWLCIAMVAVAALGLNGILASALGLPFCYWLLRGRRPPILVLGAAGTLLVIGLWRVGASWRGAQLGAWLVFTAPFRFFASWTTFGWPGFRTIVWLSAMVWLALIAAAWLLNPGYRGPIVALWIAAVLLAMLVGMARADYPFKFGPGSLYTSDRYYYVFLAPMVALCALLAASLRRPRWAGWATPVVVIAMLFGSRAHYLADVPRASLAATGQALAEGRRLVEAIRAYPVRPLVLTDASIPLDGARNSAMTLAFAIYSEYPHGISGVRLTDGSLDAQQAAIESSLLRPWTRAPSSRIDFKDGSYQEDLNSGFSWWDRPYRWMTARGELHLIAAPGDLAITAYAPVDQLHRAIHVSVSVNGQEAGSFKVATTGLRDYRIPMPALPTGSVATITLTSDLVWHARDIFPDNLDDRDLSIAVSAIGFDGGRIK
jgi:hypothetical protein